MNFLIAVSVFLHGAGYSSYLSVALYPSYDKIAHFISSITVAVLAFISILIINRFSCTKLALWQIFFCIVIFTMAIGAFWEIYEYLMDLFFGAFLVKPLQHGLDDTMIDLITDLCGGIGVAALATRYIQKKHWTNFPIMWSATRQRNAGSEPHTVLFSPKSEGTFIPSGIIFPCVNTWCISMTDASTMKMPGIPGGFLPWWLVLLQGIIALILGIFFLTSPYMTLLVVVTFLGAYWLVSGIFTLFAATDPENRAMKILLGILGIFLGLVILAYPYYSAFVVPFIFVIMVGVWALIIGGLHMYQAFTGGGWAIGILGLISVIFGLILLIQPYIATLALPFVLGILGIVFGFAAIIGSFMIRSAQKAA